jgi:predicted alpha/beta-fold hydrolase
LALGCGVIDRSAFPRFLERPPWLGGDLQTIRNRICGPQPLPFPQPSERLQFPTIDGSGDALVGSFDRPLPTQEIAAGPPLVVLLHGLTGCEDSHYMRASARHLLATGCSVLRLNLRGAGASRPSCRRAYHAGSTDDVRAVLGRLDGRLAANGIVVVGYSLGGNILLKYLGEQKRRAPLLGAVSVSAPINLKAAQVRFMHRRNRRYHDHILARMKEGIAGSGSTLTGSERSRLDEIETVYDFDDRLTAPRNGFAGADDYYARCSALATLSEICVPTLIIQARNDPWIPANAYLNFNWSANPRLVPLLPRGGGHVGFHGIGSRVSWHDRCIERFIECLTARREDRSRRRAR